MPAPVTVSPAAPDSTMGPPPVPRGWARPTVVMDGTERVPFWMVTPPEKVLSPVRVCVPPPRLLSETLLPEMMPP